jgi:hypothetical protein
MRRIILREVAFVVLLTISVFVLTLVTACGYETNSPYPARDVSARPVAVCGVPAASFEQAVYYDVSY